MNPLKTFIYRHVVPFVGSICIYRNEFVNVIYYHDIVQGDGESYMRMNVGRFKQQMRYLADHGYETLTFRELDSPSRCRWSRKKLLIAFDDGWLSNYSEIFDFMKQIGVKYNVFLEVGRIGMDDRYLNWNQVREMQESGMVGFGAHTFSHPNMKDLSDVNLEHELKDANRRIQDETGILPRDFCFPFGAFSEMSLRKVIEVGEYKRVYTSEPDYAYSREGSVIFGRNAISNDEPFKVFVNKIKGNYNVFSSLLKMFSK